MTTSESTERTVEMSKLITDTTESQMPVKEWLAIRREAGLKIDPETAEVYWVHAQTLDPYGVDPDLPKEYQQIGREYFARAPGSDVWVWFGDLPKETEARLWKKYKSKLAFPAGIFDVDCTFGPDDVK